MTDEATGRRGSILLAVEGVTKRFAGRRALDDVWLEVPRGEITAVLGPSGAGKTTLLRVIELLETPDRGSLRYRRRPVGTGALDVVAHRRRLAYVSQRPVAFARSVLDNTIMGLLLRGMEAGPAAERALPVLDRLGLRRLAATLATRLSGGELQRMALARALVLAPELLLLDEPVANLDPQNAGHVESAVRAYVREGGTVLLVTHDFFHARRLADWLGVMLDGRLVVHGPKAEVWERPGHERAARFLRGGLPA